MTLIDARLYLPASATILHLEIERETGEMTEREILERGIGDTGVVHQEVTETRGEAGEMIEIGIDRVGEMSEILEIRGMAEVVDGVEMIGMRREVVEGARIGADEETENEVSILWWSRNA
jgi:hypothetical protein